MLVVIDFNHTDIFCFQHFKVKLTESIILAAKLCNIVKIGLQHSKPRGKNPMGHIYSHCNFYSAIQRHIVLLDTG